MTEAKAKGAKRPKGLRTPSKLELEVHRRQQKRRHAWERFAELELKRARLLAELARVEAQLEARAKEVAALEPSVAPHAGATPSGGAASSPPRGEPPPGPVAPTKATFTARVLALFDDAPELTAANVVTHLGMPKGSGSMDRAKRTLQKLYETKRIQRLEPGLYSGL